MDLGSWLAEPTVPCQTVLTLNLGFEIISDVSCVSSGKGVSFRGVPYGSLFFVGKKWRNLDEIRTGYVGAWSSPWLSPSRLDTSPGRWLACLMPEEPGHRRRTSPECA